MKVKIPRQFFWSLLKLSLLKIFQLWSLWNTSLRCRFLFHCPMQSGFWFLYQVLRWRCECPLIKFNPYQFLEKHSRQALLLYEFNLFWSKKPKSIPQLSLLPPMVTPIRPFWIRWIWSPILRGINLLIGTWKSLQRAPKNSDLSVLCISFVFIQFLTFTLF